MIRKIKHSFVYFLMSALVFTGFAQSAQAAMIGTDQVVAAGVAQQNQAKVLAALDRPEIVAELEKHGVSPEDAKARVAALSDAEVATLAGKVDQLAAGGDSVIGVLVFIFVLLLVTDILGLTKIFPFTRAQR